MDGVGLIGLIKEIYSYIKNRIPAFDNVYDRALRRWTNNSSLRRKFSDNALADFDKLVSYLEDSSSVNPGLLEFFELLYEEAKKDLEASYKYEQSYETLYYVAMCYKRLGDTEKANPYFYDIIPCANLILPDTLVILPLPQIRLFSARHQEQILASISL